MLEKLDLIIITKEVFLIIEPFKNDGATKSLNVGDDLNFYIFPKYINELYDINSKDYFLGIGTILTKKRFDKISDDAKSINIFSSGAWDENIPTLNDKCNVFGVRGYRTAEKLGLSKNMAIGDGAYLLSCIDYPKAINEGKIGFIPHQSSERYIDWQSICDKAGLFYISPKQPVDDFLIALQKCSFVLTEAMHGAIISDVLRIPWVPVIFAPDFNKEKWLDFSEFMNLEIKFNKLTFMSSKKIRLLKNIESLIRKNMAILFNGKSKNKNLPITFRIATNDMTDILVNELKHFISCEKYLSQDDVFYSVVENQKKIIDRVSKIINDDHCTGGIRRKLA